jgi:hypothetical protein
MGISSLPTPKASLIELVEAMRDLPYGRPSDRTVKGMLRECRGTCSTKHLFLACTLTERFPETEPLIVHRVYRLNRALSISSWRYSAGCSRAIGARGPTTSSGPRC